MTRAIALLLLAATLALPLGACGRRGDPEVPTGQVDTLKANKYPPDDSCGGNPCPPDANSAASAAKGNADGTNPNGGKPANGQ